jgi:hypothetical protein
MEHGRNCIRRSMAIHKKMPEPPNVLSSQDNKSKIACRAFAKGCGARMFIMEKGSTHSFKRVATYGIKRGAGEAIKNANEYWYIDNGYIGKIDEYFRVCHNSMVHDGRGDYPKDRFNRLKIKLKDWRKSGNHIVLCPSSPIMQEFLGLEAHPGNWVKETIKEIRKHTDRKVIVSTKFGDGINDFQKTPSNHPFNEVIKNAWAVVTYNSSIIVKSVVAGVPVVSLSPERRIGDLSLIEDPILERDFLYNLAHQQWSLEEMLEGQAWRGLNE